MAYDQITALLGGLEGFELVGVRREPATATQPVPQIGLTLEPIPTPPKRRSRCGEIVGEIHDMAERRVPDLPILEADTWLVFPWARVSVPRAARPSRQCLAGSISTDDPAAGRGDCAAGPGAPDQARRGLVSPRVGG